ncbi:unnamed protein product [Enterobius vermicularis]|uniref:Uncharacterized protein n=1 Tax=Enterobius vermicularis TaxID=51028 RepID=A0A0N4VJ94_ENTVE|nr:unnamed protein product [Enterobius vermicularis]
MSQQRFENNMRLIDCRRTHRVTSPLFANDSDNDSGNDGADGDGFDVGGSEDGGGYAAAAADGDGDGETMFTQEDQMLYINFSAACMQPSPNRKPERKKENFGIGVWNK